MTAVSTASGFKNIKASISVAYN